MMNQVIRPSGEVSKEGGQKIGLFSHSTYYLDPNMSSLLAGDSLMLNKKDASSLTLRELKGLKAAYQHQTLSLAVITCVVQTAFS